MPVTTRRRRIVIRRRPARGDPRRERGMVTAEIAAALPALAVVLIVAVWAVALAATHLRCGDAAREAARAAARGEPQHVVRDVALAVAPDGADVDIDRSGGMVTIEVSVDVGLPLPGGDGFLGATARGRAVALEEGP
jgi:hypothetical protein